MVLGYFENKCLTELAEDGHLDETYLKSFLEERNGFLSMVRYGIEEYTRGIFMTNMVKSFKELTPKL